MVLCFLAGTCLGKSQSCEKCHAGTGNVFETALEDDFWWQNDVWWGKREREKDWGAWLVTYSIASKFLS